MNEVTESISFNKKERNVEALLWIDWAVDEGCTY